MKEVVAIYKRSGFEPLSIHRWTLNLSIPSCYPQIRYLSAVCVSLSLGTIEHLNLSRLDLSHCQSSHLHTVGVCDHHTNIHPWLVHRRPLLTLSTSPLPNPRKPAQDGTGSSTRSDIIMSWLSWCPGGMRGDLEAGDSRQGVGDPPKGDRADGWLKRYVPISFGSTVLDAWTELVAGVWCVRSDGEIVRVVYQKTEC